MLNIGSFANFMNYINKHEAPFYVEHNNFLVHGRTIEEEIELLEEDGLQTDDEVTEECIESGNLWYLRFYPIKRITRYYEFYGSTFADTLESLVRAWEKDNA